MNSQLFKRPQFPLALVGLAMLVAIGVSLPRLGAPGALESLRLPPAGALTIRHSAGDGSTTITSQAAFELLQARATGPLDVHWSESTGIPDFLTGAEAGTRIPYTPTAAERGNPVAIARGFFDENRALFRLAGVDSELQLFRLEPDLQLGFTHVRMAQVYHGIPVFGKQLVVHLDQHEQIVAVNGQFAPGIDIATQPTLTTAEAEATALRDLLEVQLEPGERGRATPQVLKGKTELMVHVDVQGRATLTWYVAIATVSPL